MTLEQELRLSYYKEIAQINAEHGIFLVQDVRSQKFYVKKRLTVYNADIYRYLQAHPITNTPEIYAVEEDGKVLTLIEEFIPGDTLEEILEKKGCLLEAQVTDIALQLCRILSVFHGCTPPIVNRDIKPSNIKITPDGVVKLLDLNAAKWSDDRAAKDTVLLGTTGYAAPEQYGFGPSSVLTDIYSLGVLMNVMLTGEFPNKKAAGGRLGQIVRKCVELSPSGRYQSVAELQGVLEVFAGKSSNTPVQTAGWRRFLPPGFRSKESVRWLFSSLGYIFLLYVCMGLEVEGAGAVEQLLNKIVFTLAMVSIVLFNGNYLGIHQKFSLTRSKHWWVRWIGMALVDITILSIAVILIGLIVNVWIK